MEWKGIDLAGSKQNEWVLTSKKTLKKLYVLLIIMVGTSFLLSRYYLQKKQEIFPLILQLNQLKNEHVILTQHIADLQNNAVHQTFIKSKELEESFKLINKFPLRNGGINSIQFYLDNNLYLRIIGKLSSQTDFQKLERFLREQALFDLKVEQVNLNQKNETSFIFTIKYKG